MWQLQQRAPSTKRLACDGIWPRAATDHVTEVVVDSMSRLRMYEVARAVSRRCQFFYREAQKSHPHPSA